MARTLQPELLDSLSPQHPDAMHSRRDLHLTNRLLGNYRWFTRTLPPLLRPGERVLELGAGSGELAQQLHRRGVAVDALDRCPAPEDWPSQHRWHRAEIQEFDDFSSYPIVIGNLIFHHFNNEQLHALGARLAESARLIFACEPCRRRRSQVLFRFIATLLGANHVTLHDAHVSIAAGFSHDELPLTLGLLAPRWDVTVGQTSLGSYRMVAIRRA